MLGILVGLALLMILAYRGWSIIWIAPICAGIVALSGGLNLLDAYTDTYMGGFADFAMQWFPVFMLGAVFGKLMEYTKMAKAIAERLTQLIGIKQAILGVILSCAILAYGGVSVFVIAFSVYPIALNMFKQADIPKRLMPATMACGTLTFAMTAIPGTPQIQNLIPTQYYNTTAMAAPIMGISSAIVMAIGGYAYLIWREKKLRAAGEYFAENEEQNTSETKEKAEDTQKSATENLNSKPNVMFSIIPLFIVIFTLNVLNFDIVVALICGILAIFILGFQYIKSFVTAINSGANGAVLATVNTSAAVGFGTVVQNVPGFTRLSELLLNVPGTPLISQAIAANVLAGATGSASGGLGIALEALSDQYIEIAQTATGPSLEAFHRVASIASGGLDALPHNGAVLTILIVTGMTHKESYGDIAIVAIVIPTLSIIPAIVLGSLGIY